jgi:hypothetical protein
MEHNEIAAKKRKRRKRKILTPALSFEERVGIFAPFAPFRSYTIILCLFIAAHVCQAAPVQLSRQVITLPANTGDTLFVDIDGDGLCDLLAIDPVQHQLLNYHQYPDGFRNSPDQVLALPPQTAWVAACAVDAHAGLALLMSTASGLVYSRQSAGLFESERRTLIEASQFFTNNDLPVLTALSTNIPVISAGRVVLYHRNSDYQWRPEPPVALDVKHTDWSVKRDEWMMGPKASHSLRVEQSWLAHPDTKRDKEPEAEAIRKTMDDMKKNNHGIAPIVERVDVNGDGREDVVLWQVVLGVLGFQTDVYIFLRGAGQQWPAQPTQVLHSRGFPILIGSDHDWSPVPDLKGDGAVELVLLEFNLSMASVSGVVETALSRGFDSSLTIRPFHGGAFSANPEASIPVKIILADWDQIDSFPICLQGDFNGDGRTDLLVRRSETQWNIFVSTNNGNWFTPQPAMTLEAPARGYYKTQDLNGDGLEDIIWHEPAEHRLSIFMSPPRPTKGKNP